MAAVFATACGPGGRAGQGSRRPNQPLQTSRQRRHSSHQRNQKNHRTTKQQAGRRSDRRLDLDSFAAAFRHY